jgi:hypothetical protein
MCKEKNQNKQQGGGDKTKNSPSKETFGESVKKQQEIQKGMEIRPRPKKDQKNK